MAVIELVNNPMERWEKEQLKKDKAELGKPSYWEWELKILRQEQVYFKQQLDRLQTKIEDEIDSALANLEALQDSETSLDTTKIRTNVEQKYAKDKKYLMKSLRQAIMDEEVHLHEGEDNRYLRLDEKYGRSEQYDMREVVANTQEALKM